MFGRWRKKKEINLYEDERPVSDMDELDSDIEIDEEWENDAPLEAGGWDDLEEDSDDPDAVEQGEWDENSEDILPAEEEDPDEEYKQSAENHDDEMTGEETDEDRFEDNDSDSDASYEADGYSEAPSDGDESYDEEVSDSDEPYVEEDSDGDEPYDEEDSDGDGPYDEEVSDSDEPYDEEDSDGDEPYDEEDSDGDEPYDEEDSNGDEPYDEEDSGGGKRRRRLIIMIAAGVVLVAAVLFFIIRNFAGTGDEQIYVQSVRELMGYSTAGGSVNRYSGTVDTQDSWKITLDEDLSVEKAYVKVGDQVKKGDKLFKYNTEELKLARDKANLDIQNYNNEIKEMNSTIASSQKSMKSASASEKITLQTEILTAQTTIKKDEYELKNKKAQLATIEKNLKKATVTSKMDGVVKSINSSVGSSSDSDSESESSDSDSSSGSDTYMTILAIGNYRIKGTVNETNAWQLNEGDSMIIRSRVDSTKTWKGTITSIDTQSTSSDSDSESSDSSGFSEDGTSGESATRYPFYVSVEDDEGLMLGQHVLIEPDEGQDEHKDGIWLSTSYICQDGSKFYVWVENSRKRLDKREVQVGEFDDALNEYEIVSGLELSDYIAIDSDSLTEGMKTTRVSSEANTSAESDTDWYEDDQSLIDSYDDSDFEDDEAAGGVAVEESFTSGE